MGDEEPKQPANPSSAARWGRRIGAVLLGLVVGLVVAEVAFDARDDGAFPHLNCYVASDELGVALEPGSTARIAFQGNPASDVSINRLGFRGPDPGEPREDEILVVGDSQAFGLGVEETDTIAARLAELTERPVLNAGVPTYGPIEYNAVARAQLEERTPRTIVWVVNMANDFFEHSRPNTERHAEWDGWAVRAETAPHEVGGFPGREWLYRQSHAFYALRQLMHDTDSDVDPLSTTGFASEGTLRDLLHGSETATEAHERAEREHDEAIARHRSRVAGLEESVEAAEDAIDDELGVPNVNTEYYRLRDDELALIAARGHPGDIVGHQPTAESSRGLYVTAYLLNHGVELRHRLEATARARADGGEVVHLLETRAERRAALLEERASDVAETFVPSVLEPRLRELADLAAAHDAEVIVVGLPLDVVVSEEEFAKYDAEPIDVSSARLLLTDLVQTAERLGMRAIDTTDALHAAEPGAFLDGDLHLSASGHRAVAEAIHERLEAPPPLPHPGPGLPSGRTPVPEPDELLLAPELEVEGASAANCHAKVVREWLRVSCRTRQGSAPTGVDLVSGGRGEALAVSTDVAATLVAPMLPGDEIVADFHWTERTRRMTARWPEGATAPVVEVGDSLDPQQSERADDAAADRLCACHLQRYGWSDCRRDVGDEWDEEDCGDSCEELYGAPSAECMAAYRDDCDALLRCARGDRERLPPCVDGRANALATGRCLPLCESEDADCEGGECVSWQGAAVCAPTTANVSSRSDPGADEEPDGEAPPRGPRSTTPTLATFGGARCTTEPVAGIRGVTAVCAADEGALLATLVSGEYTVDVRSLDAEGTLSEAADAGFEAFRTRYPPHLALACGEHRVLAVVAQCEIGYCVYARTIDEAGRPLGEPIEPIPVGSGGRARVALLADGDATWVAWGSYRGEVHVERWTVSASNAIERPDEGTDAGAGLPVALAVDGEHRAVLYLRGNDRLAVALDGRTPVEIGGPRTTPPFDLRVREGRAEVRWIQGHAPALVVVDADSPETVDPSLDAPAPAEPSTDSPLLLGLRPVRALDGQGYMRSDLHRLDRDTYTALARPVALPGADPFTFAHAWLGDRALLVTRNVVVMSCR